MAVRKLLWRNVILATTVCVLVALIWLSYHSSSSAGVELGGGSPLEELSVFKADSRDVSYGAKDIENSNAGEERFLHNNSSHRTDRDKATGRPLQSGQYTSRQQAVVEACRHAWRGYKKFAWGKDELMPVSRGWLNDYNLGLTLVDSLDTLWLLGLEEEYHEARQWVAQNLTFHSSKAVSVFETTIRILGGLLSAYHLSNDEVFLNKSRELAEVLLPAFSSKSGLPFNTVNLKTGQPQVSSRTSIAEAGSLQLEFRDLSHSTGDPRFQEAADQAMDVLLSLDSPLLPEYISTATGQVYTGSLSIGARTDSYYEYLLKLWLQSGKTEEKFLKQYLSAVSAVNETLVGYSVPSHLPFTGRRWMGLLDTTMEHLACFYPGLLALGLSHGLHPEQAALAGRLAESCYMMYKHTPTGLAAEVTLFNTQRGSTEDLAVMVDGYKLRPETVESLFLLYRLTGDEKYREWAWQIFQAIEQHCRVASGGYSNLKTVAKPPASGADLQDKMESFYLAETLKYLFLMFSDDGTLLSLKEWVFNTEAHPLPIWNT